MGSKSSNSNKGQNNRSDGHLLEYSRNTFVRGGGAPNFIFLFIDPANNATNVAPNTNITLTFTSPPIKGTGTIEIRQGSTSGTLVESFNVSTSSSITTSGNNFIINPTNNLGYTTSFYTIIPSTAITNYVGLNTTGADSHQFTTRGLALGDSIEGGRLICQSGGVRWIVAPNTSEVTRDWYTRDDANTRAQQVSGCTGWFVPTCAQLKNPGYTCNTYWDSYSSTCLYWSSTFQNPSRSWDVRISDGSLYSPLNGSLQTCPRCVRSFRCVAY